VKTNMGLLDGDESFLSFFLYPSTVQHRRLYSNNNNNAGRYGYSSFRVPARRGGGSKPSRGNSREFHIIRIYIYIKTRRTSAKGGENKDTRIIGLSASPTGFYYLQIFFFIRHFGPRRRPTAGMRAVLLKHACL